MATNSDKKKMEIFPTLDKKQQKLLLSKAIGNKTGTELAVEAGYHGKDSVNRALTNPRMRLAFEELLESFGNGEESIRAKFAKVYLDAAEANKPLAKPIPVAVKNEETGEMEEKFLWEYPDHRVRKSAADSYFTGTGDLAPQTDRSETVIVEGDLNLLQQTSVLFLTDEGVEKSSPDTVIDVEAVPTGDSMEESKSS